MVIKEKEEEQTDRLTFADLAEYMLSLTEMLTMLEDSNAPQKYALQIKICDEIDAILDALSIRK
jgi:fibrillarin-like rRNA methylase